VTWIRAGGYWSNRDKNTLFPLWNFNIWFWFIKQIICYFITKHISISILVLSEFQITFHITTFKARTYSTCQMQQAYWNLHLTIYISIYCKENTAQNSLVKYILSQTEQSSNQWMECSSSAQQQTHGDIFWISAGLSF
jgi:hypothetical protein